MFRKKRYKTHDIGLMM